MASNYTGNPTGVQAPSPAPGPNVAPIVSIPAGTDALSIESITQWAKLAADNLAYLNKIIGGTLTARGIGVNTTGGSTTIVPVGTIATTGDINIGGNGNFTGALSSTTATTKSLWIPGLSFVGRSGTMAYSTKGAITASATGNVSCSLSPYFPIGSPSFTITSIVGWWNANSGQLMQLYQAPTASSWATGSDTLIAQATSTLSSGTVWSATLSSLTATSNANQSLWLDVALPISAGFYGAYVTYTSAVI